MVGLLATASIHLTARVQNPCGLWLAQALYYQEINPGNIPSQWVIVRNSQEPIAVNLEPTNTAQQAANDATHQL